MCFVWISEQTAVISLYNINWLVFITEMECVYCAVRTGCLYIIQVMCFYGSENKQRLFPYTALIEWLIFTRYLWSQKNPPLRNITSLSVPLSLVINHKTVRFSRNSVLKIFTKSSRTSVSFSESHTWLKDINEVPSALPTVRYNRSARDAVQNS